MDPTALPTDSLYKFMALSGLALVGFFVWLVWTTQREFHALSSDVRIRVGRINIGMKEQEELQGLVHADNERTDRFVTDRTQGDGDSADAGAPAAAVANSNHRSAIAALHQRYATIQAQAEVSVLTESLKRQDVTARSLRRNYRLAAYLGLTWSLAGFGLWYWKLQMPLDRKLRFEAEVAIIELQMKRNSLMDAMGVPDDLRRTNWFD